LIYQLKNEAWCIKPFVKWTGDKRVLLANLLQRVSQQFNNCFELFIGDGLLLFNMKRSRLFGGKRIYLTNKNNKLINAYRSMQNILQLPIDKWSQMKYCVSESNFYTKFVKKLYEKFKVKFAKSDGYIDCKSGGCGKIQEVLISNIVRS
jgi:DNA adenine methylase